MGHQYLYVFVCILLISCQTSRQSNESSTSEWKSIFNGKDLSGWTVKINGFDTGENFGNTFRVANGVMVVRYDQYDGFKDRFGHIFFNQKLSSYHIKFDYRFVGDQIDGGADWAFRNSGIMLHCQSPQSMGINQNFPICIEAQLLGGDGENERSTMNLCTPGTHVEINGELVMTHCLNSSSKTYHGDQWVHAEVIVKGSDEIIHIVEGETVMVYQHPQIGGGSVSGHDESLMTAGKLLSEGYFSFQSESHPVEFKNIFLKELN